jgi:hypothetical protein
MAQIIHIATYRAQSALQAGFKQWRRCFKEDFTIGTRLGDLKPPILYRLSDPSEPCDVLYYPLILGFLGHDGKQAFERLDNRVQIQVVDIHLFLGDQVRFEMMRRLRWLARFATGQYPIFDMVRRFDQIRELAQQDPPLLSDTHSGYPEYRSLVPRDQQVFIRRLFPSTLEAFRREHISDP